MVPAVQKIFQKPFDDLEITNHVIRIELFGRQNDFHATAVPVRETTFLAVLRKDVTAFDFESLTN